MQSPQMGSLRERAPKSQELLGVGGLADHVDLATGRLNGGNGTSRSVIDLEGHLLGLELAAIDQAHTVLDAADDAGLDESFGIHDALGIELAAVDIRLCAVETYGSPLLVDGLGECGAAAPHAK